MRYKTNKPPSALLQPCTELSELKGSSGKDLLVWALQTVDTYNECKARHKALAESVVK